MLNRLGHSETYRVTLEFETAIAKALQESSNLLSTQIVVNPAAPSVLHSEFGNLISSSMHWTDTSSWYSHGTSEQMTHSVHTAHGMMLQDTEGEHLGGTQLVLSFMPQTGMQTLETAPEELPDCYITTRKSPNLHIVQRTISGGEEALLKANRMNLLCCPFVTAPHMSYSIELTIL